MIFTARQLQEKSQEQNMDLYMILTLPKNLIQTFVRALKIYGEVWLSDQVRDIGEIIPRWYACTGPK